MQNQFLRKHEGTRSGRNLDQSLENRIVAGDNSNLVLSLLRCQKHDGIELLIGKERKRMLKAVVDFQKKKYKMEKICFESLPAITVAAHRTIIPSYEDLGRLCSEVIGPEMARLGCICPEPGYCYTIEHGGYKPENIDIEYCEAVTSKGQDSSLIKFKEIPPVPLAACLKVFGPYEKLHDNYVELFAFLEKEGYKIAGDPRAVYIDGIWNQEDAEKWLTIIQVPVEKA